MRIPVDSFKQREIGRSSMPASVETANSNMGSEVTLDYISQMIRALRQEEVQWREVMEDKVDRLDRKMDEILAVLHANHKREQMGLSTPNRNPQFDQEKVAIGMEMQRQQVSTPGADPAVQAQLQQAQLQQMQIQQMQLEHQQQQQAREEQMQREMEQRMQAEQERMAAERERMEQAMQEESRRQQQQVAQALANAAAAAPAPAQPTPVASPARPKVPEPASSQPGLGASMKRPQTAPSAPQNHDRSEQQRQAMLAKMEATDGTGMLSGRAKCSQCGFGYVIADNHDQACRVHSGRFVARKWRCCGSTNMDEKGCVVKPHAAA